MFKTVKGMDDYYPQDKAIQARIADSLRQSAERASFLEVTSPAVEALGLLTKKSGEEIVSQIFTLEKRSEEQLGLRFDLTVPLARMFVDKQQSLQKPVKWFALDRMWRYEAPQKGRAREFYQLSVEVFGAPGVAADAEVISLAIDCLKNLGLQDQDISVRLNNRKLLEGLLVEFIKEEKLEQVTRIIDKVNKISEQQFLAELEAQGLSKENAEQVRYIIGRVGQPAKILPQIKTMKLNEQAQQGLQELEAVCALLPDTCVVVDLSVARGLAYYTGNVFEVEDKERKFRALAGGGRYDDLVELFGGQPTAAAGFAIGLSTLTLLLQDKGLLPKVDISPEYFIAVTAPTVLKDALQLARKLRKKKSVEVALMERKLAKQLSYANALGAKNLIVLGPNEVKKKEVKVKNMATGKETKKSLGKIL